MLNLACGDFSPQVSNIIYFFGNDAFKANANKPAGIKPVVNNNLNFIPKSGRDGAIEEIALDYAFALKISNKN